MAGYINVAADVAEENIFRVAGFPFPMSPLFTAENVERALMLKPQAGDVILSSYPRCDSTCIDYIIWKLLYMDLKHPPVNDLTNSFLPCIEMSNVDDLSQSYEHILKYKLPRLYKTYLPFKLIPFYKRAKYIYVIRTPWEACASYYNFLLLQDSVTDPFEVFLDDFLNGQVAYGSYFKHVLPWNKRVNDSNILILCHEHVEHNPRSAMFTIAAFLGDRYLRRLLDNTEVEKNILNAATSDYSAGRHIKICLPRCSFPSVPENVTDYSFESGHDDARSEKLIYTEEQIKKVTDRIGEYFKDSSVEYLWLNLLKKQTPFLFI